MATAQAFDDEMRARIAAHRAARPAGWRTLEAPRWPPRRWPRPPKGRAVVLLDCLTLLANNAILPMGDEPPEQAAEEAVAREVAALLAAYEAGDASWIVVSNEVGLGLVPAYPLGRIYRDALGRANQRLAAAADHVLFMVAGLPLTVK